MGVLPVPATQSFGVLGSVFNVSTPDESGWAGMPGSWMALPVPCGGPLSRSVHRDRAARAAYNLGRSSPDVVPRNWSSMPSRASRKGGVLAAPGDRRPRSWADHIPGASGSRKSRQERGTSLATAGGGRVTRCGATAGLWGCQGGPWPLAGAFRDLSCWVHGQRRRVQTSAGKARAWWEGGSPRMDSAAIRRAQSRSRVGGWVAERDPTACPGLKVPPPIAPATQ